MSRSLARACFLLVLLPAPLLLGGCGGSTVARVTGTVRFSGKPVPRLVVHFVPAEGRPSQGVTDENGHYKLMHEKKREGALRGSHKVFFTYRPRDPKEELEMQEGKLVLPAIVQAVLNNHGSEEKALQYDVTTDPQVIDIDIN
jgi:hypothetical protein